MLLYNIHFGCAWYKHVTHDNIDDERRTIMADPHDTLNIGSLRLRKEYPVAQTGIEFASSDYADAKTPKAARAARARIAAIPDGIHTPLHHPDALSVHLATAAPTAK